MPLILRAMAPGDLDPVFALARATAGPPQWPREEYQRMLLPDPDALLDRSVLVAYCGQALVGFAVSSLLRGESFAELEMIVIDSAFRRRGMGSSLLHAAMQAASHAGAEIMRLEVRPSNEAALALYLKQGFRETGRRRLYYSAPVEDAVLLEASLRTSADL